MRHLVPLLVVIVVACGRLLAHAALDERPRFGGGQTSDLSAIMTFHQALRGLLDLDFGEALRFYSYKPPLYYGGMALLFAQRPTLAYGPLLAVQAGALALSIGAAWTLGRRLGGPRAAPWAAAVFACLPGVVARFHLVNVEPWHTAALGWALVFLLQLREPTVRAIAGLALTAGAGLMMKWSFAAYLAPALLWELGRAIRMRRWGSVRAQLVGVGLAAVPFALWLGTWADLQKIRAGVGGEPSFNNPRSAQALLFLPRWLAHTGLGPWALPVLLLAALAWLRRDSRPRGPAASVALTALGLLLLHTAIPHKEGRYLLPALLPLAVLVAAPLARLRPPALPAAALALLFTGTHLAPWLSPAPVDLQPEATLRPDRNEHGLDQIVLHSSLRRSPPARVMFVVGGRRAGEVLTMLMWELYARSDTPVFTGRHRRWLEGEGALRDLRDHDHLVANRPLEPAERRLLQAEGYALLAAAPVALGPDSTHLELWARPRGILSPPPQ